MAIVWEYQLDGWNGNGWKGWRVTATTERGELVYAFDERGGVLSPIEALRATLAQSQFDDFDDSALVLEVEPIRTLVSAEVSPN